MERKTVEEKVNNMLRNKSIDARFIPFIHVFFQTYNQRYSLTEEQLDYLLKNYSDNINETFFVNMKNREIKLDAKGQIMLIDTELKNGVLSENIENLIQQSMVQQAIATLPSVDAKYNKGLYSFYEFNELNDLQENKDLNVSTLLNLVKAVIGKGPTQLLTDSSYIEMQGNIASRDAHRYINEAMKCFNKIKNDKVVTPEICKRIYGFCVIALMYNYDDKAINNFEAKKCIVELLENMKTLQKKYSIDERSLEKIDMQENGSWQFPAGNRLREIMSKVNLNKVEYEEIAKNINNEHKEGKKLQVNEERIAEIINNVKKPQELTEKFISQKVSELVQTNKYVPYLEPIIFEFFRRSAIVYNWDEDDFIKKVNNFANNVKAFEISHKNDEKSIAGEFSAFYKNITIPKDTVIRLALGLESYEGVLETLFHEMRHATDYTDRNNSRYEDGMNIKSRMNINTEKIDFINEKFVEGGAQLVTGAKYADKLKTSLAFDGYESFAKPLGMLSSAVGLSDIELLKIGEKGLPKFLDILKKDIPSLDENLEKLFTEYSILMKVDESGKLFLRKVKTKVLSRIYQINQEMYDERIENNPPETEKERDKAEYEQYKIFQNLYNMCRKYGVNSKLLKELTGMDFKELKEKIKLTKEQKDKFLNLVYEYDTYKFDNKGLVQSVKKSVRAMYERRLLDKKIKRGNETLPQGNINAKKIEQQRQDFLKGNMVDTQKSQISHKDIFEEGENSLEDQDSHEEL